MGLHELDETGTGQWMPLASAPAPLGGFQAASKGSSSPSSEVPTCITAIFGIATTILACKQVQRVSRCEALQAT